MNCCVVTLSHFRESEGKNDICLWFSIWNFALAWPVTANICKLLCALKKKSIATTSCTHGPWGGQVSCRPTGKVLGPGGGCVRTPECLGSPWRHLWVQLGAPYVRESLGSQVVAHWSFIHLLEKRGKKLWLPKIKITQRTHVNVKSHLVPRPLFAPGRQNMWAQYPGGLFLNAATEALPVRDDGSHSLRGPGGCLELGRTQHLTQEPIPLLVWAGWLSWQTWNDRADVCVGRKPHLTSVLPWGDVCVHR